MVQIHELSRAAGISPETIRYYERIGILPRAQRAPNGYRVYAEADTDRLRFIGGARRLGLSLDEIAGILAFRNQNLAPCVHVHELIAQKIVEVRERIRELERLRDELQRLNAAGESLPLDVEMQDCVCGLIKTVNHHPHPLAPLGLDPF